MSNYKHIEQLCGVLLNDDRGVPDPNKSALNTIRLKIL